MLLEQQGPEGAGWEQDGERGFRNEDGTPATWIELVPERSRRTAFALRAGIGLIPTLAILGLLYTSDSLDLDRAVFGTLFGLLPLVIGLFFGNLAYGRMQEVRRYSVTHVSYTRRQRLRRAGKWWLWGSVLLAGMWWFQVQQGQFGERWWYAWPLLLFFIVGLGLYRLRGEAAFSPAAAKAKAYFAGLEQQAKAASFDRLFNAGPLIRYALAIACLYAAYYLGTESTEKNAGLGAIAFIFLAGLFAREVSKWVLGLALVGAIIWAVIAGIAALPVSLAIIIGALIIASASKK